MKKPSHCVLWICIAGLLISPLPSAAATAAANAVTPQKIIYVSPKGKDSNSGTKKAPLATMNGARKKIAAIKAKSGLPTGGIMVYFRGGKYKIKSTVTFTQNDSGTKEAPIIYCAYPGEKPIFTGGKYIKGSKLKKVTNKKMLSRLPKNARKKVVCYNLFKNGFSKKDLDYSKDFWKSGNLKENVNEKYKENDYFVPRMQVFINDKALHLARYPNKVEGIFTDNPYNAYLKIPKVLESGFNPDTEEANGKQCKFTTWENRIKKWKNRNDIIIFGMMGWEFSHGEVVADKINQKNMTISLKATPLSGVSEGSRYGFANVFEELDKPGEYYIDKKTGVLYLYPTKNIKKATVKISGFDKGFMINAKDLSYVTFSKLTFELTKGSVMNITGGENCKVKNCTLKNFGINGVRLGEGVIPTRDCVDPYKNGEFDKVANEISTEQNGIGHKVTGCKFINTGYSAAVINSGNSALRERGGAVFEKNIVKHSGLIGSCYYSGLLLSGAGIKIKNNAFYFCRGQAITGNVVDTDIIYNEFCDSPSDMAEDTGTIYINFLCLNDGVKIRYNYFHDVTNRDHPGVGFDFARRAAAAYDNQQPFSDLSYNVIYNVPCNYTNPLGSLGPTTMINNIFIDCDYVLAYPSEYLSEYYNGETGKEIISKEETLQMYYESGIYKSDLWKEKYPDLYNYYDYMENEKTDMWELMAEVKDNLIIYLEKPMSDRASELPSVIPLDTKYGIVENNHFLNSDPGFKDKAKKDFQLTKEGANKYGITWLDMSEIGVASLKKPIRISDKYKDPLKNTRRDTRITVKFTNGKPLTMVTLWRKIENNHWEWVDDSAVNGEGMSGFTVKAKGTYTVFYHGDENHYAQYAGGLTGQVPPKGVKTFFVPKGQDQWDSFTFSLKKR